MPANLTYSGPTRERKDCLNELVFGNGKIPGNDYQAIAYYGSTNNIETITYKAGGSGGTTVAVQTFAYAGGGAADDDTLTSITTTYP